jgi:hypothetical protein
VQQNLPDFFKMKRNRLEIEYSYDFELLGLTTSAKGYKLAWELNRSLNIRLLKKADLCISTKPKEEATYSFHAHETAMNTLRLFKNRPNEASLAKNLLVPEFPHVDYIIMVQGEELNGNRLQEELRSIPSIEWVAFIPLDALKSKNNFIF